MKKQYTEKSVNGFSWEGKGEQMKLRIGTRKSRLAMVQTELVRDQILAHFPDMELELVPISTKGDQHLDRS